MLPQDNVTFFGVIILSILQIGYDLSLFSNPYNLVIIVLSTIVIFTVLKILYNKYDFNLFKGEFWRNIIFTFDALG